MTLLAELIEKALVTVRFDPWDKYAVRDPSTNDVLKCLVEYVEELEKRLVILGHDVKGCASHPGEVCSLPPLPSLVPPKRCRYYLGERQRCFLDVGHSGKHA